MSVGQVSVSKVASVNLSVTSVTNKKGSVTNVSIGKVLVTIVSKDKSSLVLWKSASHKCVNWINGMAPIFKSTSVGFEASLKQEKKEKKNKSDTFHSNNNKKWDPSHDSCFLFR